jgi:hypothetical protein
MKETRVKWGELPIGMSIFDYDRDAIKEHCGYIISAIPASIMGGDYSCRELVVACDDGKVRSVDTNLVTIIKE